MELLIMMFGGLMIPVMGSFVCFFLLYTHWWKVVNVIIYRFSWNLLRSGLCFVEMCMVRQSIPVCCRQQKTFFGRKDLWYRITSHSLFANLQWCMDILIFILKFFSLLVCFFLCEISVSSRILGIKSPNQNILDDSWLAVSVTSSFIW